jgi:MazG family protein
VFGASRVADADAQTVAWEAQKARERAGLQMGALDGVPLNLPALARAQKLGRRAARVGFDWPDAGAVLRKLDEERAELEQAMAAHEQRPEDVGEELGDLLFTVVNLARHLEVDAEASLRRANLKFERRFRAVEARLAAAGKSLEQTDPEALERLWSEVKEAEAGH